MTSIAIATMLPLDSLLAAHRELGLILAVAIGFGFGFVLERAGFGRSTTLAAQFYFTDMTVFKVMFGAIVTAMIGLPLAAGLGLADLQGISESVASTTYIWPMLAGGLLLGAGFIISGYCPGTSAVASASGNVDGMFAFGGVIIGSVLYGEIQPAMVAFHNSGELGQLFFWQLLGVPAPVLALLVAGMAGAAFLGAEWVERFMAKRKGQTRPDQRRGRRMALATYGVLGVLGVATLAFPGAPVADPQPSRATYLTPVALAHRVLEEPWTLRVLDVRPHDACVAARVPGSECAPKGTLGDLGLAYAPPGRDLVVIGAAADASVPLEALAYKGRVFALGGGFEAWKAYALTAPPQLTADASDAARFRAALFASLTGAKQAPPPTAPTKKYVPKKKKKGGGCA